ncbi:hypothetical protein ACLKA7_011601 [Drosophila subpalustris]
MLGIDEASKDDNVSRSHQLFFRFGMMPVSGLKKRTKKSLASQADHTNPLEDLAEDEDLAELTLDPAMAAEIEEQMAMEAAGDALTARDVTWSRNCSAMTQVIGTKLGQTKAQDLEL